MCTNACSKKLEQVNAGPNLEQVNADLNNDSFVNCLNQLDNNFNDNNPLEKQGPVINELKNYIENDFEDTKKINT